MTLKDIFLEISPPVLIKVLKKYFFSKEEKFDFIGNYKSLDEAAKYNTKLNYYVNDDYDKIYVDEFKSSLKKFSKRGQGRSLIVGILSSVLKNDETMTIVDWGGGTNPVFQYHWMSKLREKDRFIVVDRENLIEQITNAVDLPSNIVLMSENSFLNAPVSNVNIWFFGSSIQYSTRIYELFDLIEPREGALLIFAESIFTDYEDDITVLQTNVPSTVFPNIWYSKNKFISSLNKKGWKMVYEQVHSDLKDLHKHASIDPQYYEFWTYIFLN